MEVTYLCKQGTQAEFRELCKFTHKWQSQVQVWTKIQAPNPPYSSLVLQCFPHFYFCGWENWTAAQTLSIPKKLGTSTEVFCSKNIFEHHIHAKLALVTQRWKTKMPVLEELMGLLWWCQWDLRGGPNLGTLKERLPAKSWRTWRGWGGTACAKCPDNMGLMELWERTGECCLGTLGRQRRKWDFHWGLGMLVKETLLNSNGML